MKKILKVIVSFFILTSILFASIDLSKRIITVKTFTTLYEAKKLLKPFTSHDALIYKKIINNDEVFILYLVNIQSKNHQEVLNKVQKYSSKAYVTSDKMERYLRTLNSSEAFFLKAQKIEIPLIKNENENENKVKKIKKVTIKNEETYNIIKIVQKNENENEKEKQKKYFVDLMLGLGKIDVKKKNINGSISLARKADESSFNLAWQIGYRFNTDSFSTFGYSHSSLDAINLHNYALSYNYYLLKNNYKPYIGVLAGISFIELKKSLINGELKDKTGQSKLLGIQVGIEKDITSDMAVFTKYQYLKLKHERNLKSDNVLSQIIRKNQSNINIGLRWNFDY